MIAVVDWWWLIDVVLNVVNGTAQLKFRTEKARSRALAKICYKLSPFWWTRSQSRDNHI